MIDIKYIGLEEAGIYRNCGAFLHILIYSKKKQIYLLHTLLYRVQPGIPVVSTVIPGQAAD